MNALVYARTTHCVDVCNRLLRGELSAVATYQQAIRKFANHPAVDWLEGIREDHVRSAASIEGLIRDLGGVPDRDSGTWGRFVRLVQATANLIGEDSAVSSLESGERHGRSDYLRALENAEVFPECKDSIRRVWLPRIEQHIERLQQLQARWTESRLPQMAYSCSRVEY